MFTFLKNVFKKGELRQKVIFTLGILFVYRLGAAITIPSVNTGASVSYTHLKPTVRGSVMNPNDHPHGGGEGRTSIGRKAPMTPWGKKAMGVKDVYKRQSQYIARYSEETLKKRSVF